MILTQSLKEHFTSWLYELGLVTRQEFDIQSKVLMNTRTKVEQLEKEVQKLTQGL